MNIEIIGFVGAGLMVATLAMKTMIPLRAVGVISSIFQIAFALFCMSSEHFGPRAGNLREYLAHLV